jgi:hypothetical protein
MNDSFGHWLAGFTDGEGSFNIQRNAKGARYCHFRLVLHGNDRPTLKMIQNELGIGTLWVGHPASQYGTRAAWTVQSKSECLKLVEIFEQFPLRSKKSRDFKIWAQAVRNWQTHSKGRKSDWSAIDDLREQLCNGRVRKGFAWQPRP